MSMFRSPDEVTSSVESEKNDIDHVIIEELIQNPTGDHGLKQPEHNNRALSPPARRFARDSSTPVFTFPNLMQHQRESLFHLSLMEKECRSTAASSLNETREPGNHLPEDHPDIKLLAARLFTPLAKEWSERTGLSADLIGDNGATFRDALSASFRDYLSKAAAKELRDLRSPSSPKSIAANLVAFEPVSERIPLYPIDEGGPAPSLISGAKRSPFKLDSIYENEYHEILALGKGGYGQVLRVRSHLDAQEYAIKQIVITSQRVRRYLQEDQVDALLAEVRTLAKLNHTNIVRYYHAWIEYKPSGHRPTTTTPLEKRVGNLRILPEPETQETDTEYDLTDSLGTQERQQNNQYEVDEGLSQDLGPGLDQEIYDDDVVFGLSSVQHSQGPHDNSARVRQASHTINASNVTLQTSVLSVAEDDNDPEVENIPRAAGEIGLSLSKADLSVLHAATGQPQKAEYFGPDITLFIKMSLHPMTLSRYLSMESPKDSDTAEIRHCFHQESSIGILAAILDGLDYLHSQRIVHRDIKPANIFLSIHEEKAPSLGGCVNIMGCPKCSHSDKAKRIYVTPCIGDFGLIAELKEPAKSSAYDPEVPLFEPSRLSALQHKPVGTMLYRPATMPKEEPIICPKLDVYSLGVIALEMIHKFGTKSERATVLSNLKQGVLPLELEDHAMAGGIRSMSCEDRDRRWDCGAVRHWLEGLQGKGKGAM